MIGYLAFTKRIAVALERIADVLEADREDRRQASAVMRAPDSPEPETEADRANEAFDALWQRAKNRHGGAS